MANVSKNDVLSFNGYLSTAQMQINATYIYQYLKPRGWTRNAVAGMLGNLQRESSINPGIWQNLDEGNMSMGFGLVQWTPATNLINWANANGLEPTDIDTQLQRILYEKENGLQYDATDAYPLSFTAFTKSTQSPEYLASAFLYNYERAGVAAEEERRINARQWYSFLEGVDAGDTPDVPDEPDEPDTPVNPNTKPKAHRLSLLMMYTAIRK